MTTTQLVMTALGPDRPGIVDTISKHVFEHGGNIEDSRMAVLGSEFAMIMRITGSEVSMEQIQHNAAKLEHEAGVSIIFKRTSFPSKSKTSVLYKITVTCLDHPGVVHQISSLIAAKQINIEAMETTSYKAPVTGSQLFRFEAIISIPPSASKSGLRKALDRLAEEKNFDIRMEAHPSDRMA
jgi:glycine cleavage system transcriptional repressor